MIFIFIKFNWSLIGFKSCLIFVIIIEIIAIVIFTIDIIAIIIVKRTIIIIIIVAVIIVIITIIIVIIKINFITSTESNFIDSILLFSKFPIEVYTLLLIIIIFDQFEPIFITVQSSLLFLCF